jgi:hypothetical protein
MQEGLNGVIVNPGIVLGPDSPIAKILDRYKKGLRWYTPGTNGYVGIEDVIEVMDQLMNSKINGERFILVAENWTGKAIAKQMLRFENRNKVMICIPKSLLYLLWVLEHLLQVLGLRKRFLTRAMISSQFKKKEIDGKKIKSFIDFDYTPLEGLLS